MKKKTTTKTKKPKPKSFINRPKAKKNSKENTSLKEFMDEIGKDIDDPLEDDGDLDIHGAFAD